MDINQIIFITAILFLIFILKIYPVIYQNKQARYSRYFRKNSNIRFSLVKQISIQQDNLPDDLAIEEMIAVLALISAKNSVSHAYETAIRFADMGWKDRFNEEFFTKLFSIAKRFQNGFWYRESTELMNLGKMLSKKYNYPEWIHAFHMEVETMKRRRLSNMNLRRSL